MLGLDPRAAVEAPVRRALARLVIGGTILFAVVVLAGLCVPLCHVDPTLRHVTHFGSAGLLAGYVLATQVMRWIHGRPAESLRNSAWSRASEVDRSDTLIAGVVTAAVPVGVLAALVVMVWPHLGVPHVRAAEYGLWVPALGLLWAFATARWVEEAREHLARAIQQSELRLRAYWAAPRA